MFSTLFSKQVYSSRLIDGQTVMAALFTDHFFLLQFFVNYQLIKIRS